MHRLTLVNQTASIPSLTDILPTVCLLSLSQLFPMRASIPGCVTNTGGTFRVPAALVSVALYVPLLAELAVMVRVKL